MSSGQQWWADEYEDQARQERITKLRKQSEDYGISTEKLLLLKELQECWNKSKGQLPYSFATEFDSIVKKLEIPK